MNASEIRSSLACGRGGCDCSKAGVKTHCPGPSHRNGDKNPSLGVEEKGGKTLVSCYGGCDQGSVIAALQERGMWPRREERETNGRGPGGIVATYDYRDASGGLSFQVVRMQPKDFRQRRPKAEGGWEWKAGDRSLIYRLPELLAASDDEIVFVPEGEKDVDRVRSLGLIATTNAGGAGKWSDGNSRWLAGRRVAILGDRDAAGEKDVALKLRSIGAVARVAVVPLDGLSDKEDISDWLDRGGTAERLVGLAEAALEAVPPVEEPVPITLPVIEREPLPAFPTEVLTGSLRRLIEDASMVMAVPVEFLGLPLLVLAGSAIGNAWEFWVHEAWKEGANLYGGIVAEPGSKKSPALGLAQRALHKVQQRLAYEHSLRVKAHKEEVAAIERLPKAERTDPPDPPRFPHVYTTDATTEALGVMLLNSKGIAVIKDELVGWVTGMDQYHGGKGADRQHYLEAWSRKSLKIDRKGSVDDPIIVPHPCLSVIGGVQPDMVSKMINESGGDDGFIDRMLWAYPPPMPNRFTRAKVDQAALASVERLFESLFALRGIEHEDGSMTPRAARPDDAAERVWEAWANAHYAEEQSDALPYSLKGAWSKFEGQYLRLALILHVTEAVDHGLAVPALISGATMAKAQVLVDFFKAHAREALGAARTSRSSLEDRILRALKAHGPLTTTELYGVLGGGQVNAQRLKAALERLAEQAYIVAETVKREGRGRPATRWACPEKEPVPLRRRGEAR